MNDVTYVEAARLLAAANAERRRGTPEERLAWAFRTVTSRLPNEREIAGFCENLEKQLDYSDGSGEAAKLLDCRREAELIRSTQATDLRPMPRQRADPQPR